MSAPGTEEASQSDDFGPGEVMRIVDQLDKANDHLMLVNRTLADLLEDAVTHQVALERRVDELQTDLATATAEWGSTAAQVRSLRGENAQLLEQNLSLGREVNDVRANAERLEAEIAALSNTKLMRAAAPLRRLYTRGRPHRE